MCIRDRTGRVRYPISRLEATTAAVSRPHTTKSPILVHSSTQKTLVKPTLSNQSTSVHICATRVATRMMTAKMTRVGTSGPRRRRENCGIGGRGLLGPPPIRPDPNPPNPPDPPGPPPDPPPGPPDPASPEPPNQSL